MVITKLFILLKVYSNECILAQSSCRSCAIICCEAPISRLPLRDNDITTRLVIELPLHGNTITT